MRETATQINLATTQSVRYSAEKSRNDTTRETATQKKFRNDTTRETTTQINLATTQPRETATQINLATTQRVRSLRRKVSQQHNV